MKLKRTTKGKALACTGIKSTTPKNKRGPKRVFTKQQLDEVENLVGMYGARNKELALYFDVAETSIDYWIKNFPEFERVVKRGRVAIGMKVAKALVAKAIGYSHPDTHYTNGKIKTTYPDGTIEERTEVIKTPIIKYYPPDGYSANKYLTIMFREMWAENNQVNINHNHSGSITHRKIEEIKIEELSKEEQDILFNLNIKQIVESGSN